MKLKIYLVMNNLTIKKFSEMINCTAPYISRIIRGELLPGRALAKKIAEATNGEVIFATKPQTAREEKLLKELEVLRKERVLYEVSNVGKMYH